MLGVIAFNRETSLLMSETRMIRLGFSHTDVRKKKKKELKAYAAELVQIWERKTEMDFLRRSNANTYVRASTKQRYTKNTNLYNIAKR